MTSADPTQPDGSNQSTRSSLTLEPTRWAGRRDWIDAVALVAVLGTFWHVGGAWGAIAWIGVAVSWSILPVVVAVAIGQFALVAITPAQAGVVVTLPGAMALLALLVGDIVKAPQDIPDGLLFIGSTMILGGGVIWLAWTVSFLAAAIGVLAVLGLGSYLIHRLGLFELGHLTHSGAGE